METRQYAVITSRGEFTTSGGVRRQFGEDACHGGLDFAKLVVGDNVSVQLEVVHGTAPCPLQIWPPATAAEHLDA